ncbi:MAG TPA: Wadjet anti-phage system protein JetA family protein [Anaerolineales bacterium]|nr:Wadjet anti-phage system protein JetA family protein [Anaerolineales bacterium]
MAANPFDLLPANLFNLFSTLGHTTLQRHYMAILLRLYALAEFNRFGLAREVVVAEIVDYLRAAGAQAEAEVAAEMAEQDAGGTEGASLPSASLPSASLPSTSLPSTSLPSTSLRAAGTGQKTEHDYAAYLLRRLAETGWVEREQHADYSETIILPDYAFTLLEALRAIQEQKPREFAGQLYTAHQLLTSSRSKDFSPALALTQAYENVRQVVRGLNELNQNIRRYIERATRGRDVAELLRLQFDDYSQTLGPAYHALKTSDHVSRYRRDIVGKLQAWQRSGEWLDHAAEELAAQGRFTPAQAEQEIQHAIQFVVHQLEGLDPLLEEIDRRHAQYFRTSLRQIRYQLVSADGSFKDRLVSLARGLAALQAEGETTLPDEAPNWQYHPAREPDMHSFYTPPRRRAPLNTAPVVAPALQPTELAALRSATLQDVTQALTPDKINRYVLGFFNGHRVLHVTEFPSEVLADLHRLTTIIAYADHPEVKYGLELADGDPVEIGPYRVMSFQLAKL